MGQSSMETMTVVAVGGALLSAALGVLFFRSRSENDALRSRLSPLLDVEKEATKARAESGAGQAAARRELESTRQEIAALRTQYSAGRAHFEQLDAAVRSLEENLESIEVGLYRPHFTYADAESYKAAIEQVRRRQTDMIKQDQAATCGTTWQVGGSKREGERMVKQTQKLILRAFNAESEAAVANVSWNNFKVMEARINKAFEILNKLGTVLQVALTDSYRNVRLEELKLVFEAAEKRQQEREEQRRQRAEQREEEKVQRELLREQEEAAQEEAKYQKALAKAQQDLGAARDAERDAMLGRIHELEANLAAAHDRKERAIAQAQLTKVGHVYVISNIGAFGEGVVKIGLTRRLEPQERVQELGDASVPFPFDVHAMIYSENAPELENRLQTHFWDRRLNWANDRKEFFRAALDEIEGELRSLGLTTEILKIAEAKEYRQTVAAVNEKAQQQSASKQASTPRFPEDPFAAFGPESGETATTT